MKAKDMSYRYVIDSYAWIEYFRGSPLGDKAKEYIESGDAATATITLAELRAKYLREGWSFFQEDLAFISSKTTIVPLEKELAVEAGRLHHELRKTVKDWSFSDSIVLATARAAAAGVVTGDRHFQGLKGTILLE